MHHIDADIASRRSVGGGAALSLCRPLEKLPFALGLGLRFGVVAPAGGGEDQ